MAELAKGKAPAPPELCSASWGVVGLQGRPAPDGGVPNPAELLLASSSPSAEAIFTVEPENFMILRIWLPFVPAIECSMSCNSSSAGCFVYLLLRLQPRWVYRGRRFPLALVAGRVERIQVDREGADSPGPLNMHDLGDLYPIPQ